MGHEFTFSRRQAVVAGTALAGLAGSVDSLAQATPEPQPGGTLRIGVQGDPTNLDPHLTVLAAAGVIVPFAYEGLVTVDSGLNPIPSLAESWTVSDDLLTYTFALKTGAAFHNGRAFVANDVVYSFNRVLDPDVASPSASYASGIAEMTAPNDATVVITLAAPDASFLTKLAWWGMSIVPHEAVDEHGDLALTMVGTGPFVFDEYIPNTSLTFSRNAAYWDAPKPYVETLEVLIASDDTARTAALISDTVDIIEQVPHRDIGALQANNAVNLAGSSATNLRWIVFNLRRSPFDMLDVRRAIAAALERQQIIDSSVFGYGEPLVGLYPPSYWAGYQGDVPEQDLDGAKALMASVTVPEGFRPGLLTWAEYDFLSNASVVVQEQLRQVGIEAEIEPEENATYINRFFSGDFDIAVMGASGYMDPNEWLEQSLKTDGPNNAAGFSDAELDSLIEQGLREHDREARAEIYQQAQQLVIDQAPWVSLFTSDTYEGLQPRVQGFVHYLNGSMQSARDVWLDEG